MKDRDPARGSDENDPGSDVRKEREQFGEQQAHAVPLRQAGPLIQAETSRCCNEGLWFELELFRLFC